MALVTAACWVWAGGAGPWGLASAPWWHSGVPRVHIRVLVFALLESVFLGGGRGGAGVC